jgi:glycosyltransferase involved in cell wall biosynthesis
VIVGEGREYDRLVKLASGLGLANQVVFVGRVDHSEVLRIVTACDIYVHTSLRETQGLVLNEAAACGKPLIMIDRDVNPVLQDGENGLFADNSVKSVSETMKVLLEHGDKRERFGKRSLELAKTMSKEIVSKKLADLYEKVLSGDITAANSSLSTQ